MDGGDHNGQDAAPVGAVLERARKERGLSLRDAEDATKIRTRYLDGLEREDFSVLPDAVYVQGFLKTYANYLGLDGEDLAREFKKRRWPRRERQFTYVGPRESEFERPLVSPGGLSGTNRRGISGAAVFTVVLAVLVLAAVIGALYYVGVRSAGSAGDQSAEAPAQEAQEPAPEEQPAEEPAEEPEPTPEPSEESAEEPPAREQPEPAATPPPDRSPSGATDDEAVQVTLRVSGVASWLSVQADGAIVYEQLAQPGFDQTFEATDAVTVSTGNAGYVTAEVNGEDFGYLGNVGQVATLTFDQTTAEQIPG